jgi:hypothetical protein
MRETKFLSFLFSLFNSVNPTKIISKTDFVTFLIFLKTFKHEHL